MPTALARLALVLPLVALGPACNRVQAPPQGADSAVRTADPAARFPAFPARPRAMASAAFHAAWSDGNAELTSYDVVTPRYGEPRPAELVLVYVTEPMNRRTWIKDDDARGDDRVNVLKLNVSLKFETGVYPYSVMTSVFAPLDAWRAERFAPVKITLGVQEWCGHVWAALWPGEDTVRSELRSYFASEGERDETTPTRPGTLYEDALLIQLRELDGPFAGGSTWEGELVPSLWRTRRAHTDGRPVPARITRSAVTEAGVALHRFVLEAGSYRRTLDVEAGGAHQVIAWETSDGERVRRRATARLPYWQLNREADRVPTRERLGLDTRARPSAVEAPAGPAGR